MPRRAVLCCWSLSFLIASWAFADSIPPERIDALAPLLPEKACGMGRPITDREAWQTIARAKPLARAVAQAEALQKRPIAELPDELFLDFSKTGNRRRCEAILGQRHGRLPPLVLAECIENHGRFLPAIEETIRAIAAEKTWVMPAHDRTLANFRGTSIDIDLGSATMGREMATAAWWLGDRLSPEVRKLVADELARRIFQPYRKAIARKRVGGWLTTTNNWNAVCLAGVTGAALATLESRAERAFFVAAAEKYVQNFLRGFTDDGYCYEGMGYWNYGFGNYVLLSETIRQATGGKVDWMENPKVRTIALFGRNLEILPGIYPALSDCHLGSQPDGRLMAFLSRRFGLGLADVERRGLGWNAGASALFEMGVMAFPNAATKIPAATQAAAAQPLRHWFSDAGILVCRPQPGRTDALGAVLAGCHNDKPHNHNDVGTFVVALGQSTPLLDPGAEIYTARTFSSRRYESNVLNSFGHPVPRVAGQLQRTGRSAAARVVKTEFTENTDTLVLDIRSAYAVPLLEKLERTFVFSRAGRGSLSVSDEVQLGAPQPFGTALITLSPWKSLAADQLRVGEGQEAVHVTIATDGPAFTLQPEPIHEDLPHKLIPIRLGIELDRPVTKARITLTIAPAGQGRGDGSRQGGAP